MNTSLPPPNARSTTRPWNVALLVWLAICCVSAIVLLAELQFSGPEHFKSAKGSSEIRSFLEHVLVYPGLLLPALIVFRPSWSLGVCLLLLAAALFMLVSAVARVHIVAAFWVGGVLPVVLVATATFLAYRRRDWQAKFPSSAV